MKKLLRCFLFFVLLFSVRPVQAQNAFYDASNLIRLKNASANASYSNDTAVLRILASYLDTNATRLKAADVLNLCMKNAMLKEYAEAIVLRLRKIDTLAQVLYKKYGSETKVDLDHIKSALWQGNLDISKYMDDIVTLKLNIAAWTKASKHLDSLTWKLQRDSIHDSRFKDVTDSLTFVQRVTALKAELKDSIDKTNPKITALLAQINDKTLPGEISKLATSTNLVGKLPGNFAINLAAGSAAVSSKAVTETGSAASFKLPSQSEVIDALAIFIANRVKDDIALTFVNKLKEKLDNDTSLARLFPKTIMALDMSDNYQTPVFGSRWQQALASDVATLPEHLLCHDVIKGDSKLIQLQPLVELFTLQRQGYSLFDAALLVGKRGADKKEGAGFYKALQLMRVLALELSSTDRNAYFISLETLGQMSDEQFKVYVGLLLEKYTTILAEFGIKKDIPQDSIANQLTYIRGQVLDMLAAFQQLQTAVLAQRSSRDGTTIQHVEAMWDASRAILLTAARFNIGGKRDKTLAVIEPYINTADNVFNIYKDIAVKNYTSLLGDAADLLGDMLKRHSQPEDNMNGKFLEGLEYRFGKRSFLKGRFVKGHKKIVAEVEALLNNPAVINKDQLRALLKKNGVDTLTIAYVIDMLLSPSGTFDLKKRIEALKDTLSKEVRKQVEDFVRIQLENPATVDLKKLQALINSPELKEKGRALLKKALTDKALFDSLSKEVSGDHYVEIVRLLSFISDALKADNSKALSQVISVYAAPPNSYRVKRNTRASIDLNAYPGLFAGAEWRMATLGHIDSVGFAGGFTCPIGFTFSRGMRRPLSRGANVTDMVFADRRGRLESLTGRSFSLTLSVVDIGAVVAYRIAKGESDGLPKQVNWAQVFSPGISMQIGFKNVPLSFNFGTQISPQLRSFNNSSSLSDAIRLSAGLVFDVPLYNLYKKDMH